MLSRKYRGRPVDLGGDLERHAAARRSRWRGRGRFSGEMRPRNARYPPRARARAKRPAAGRACTVAVNWPGDGRAERWRSIPAACREAAVDRREVGQVLAAVQGRQGDGRRKTGNGAGRCGSAGCRTRSALAVELNPACTIYLGIPGRTPLGGRSRDGTGEEHATSSALDGEVAPRQRASPHDPAVTNSR